MDKLSRLFIAVMTVPAMWLNVTQPLGRPFGHPAFVASDQARAGLDPTGFNQALGVRHGR